MTTPDPAKFSDDPLSEIPSTIGLVLTIAAVMLAAVSLAGISAGQVAAGALGVLAFAGFVAAIGCFAMDVRRHEDRNK